MPSSSEGTLITYSFAKNLISELFVKIKHQYI
jgi:hypothetical protein